MAKPARNTASTLRRNKVKGIHKPKPKPNPERSAHKLRSSFYSQKAIDTFAQECYREYRLQRAGNNNARHLDTDEILAFCLGLVNCGRHSFQKCLDIYEGKPRLQNIVPLVFHPQNPEAPENAENSEMSDSPESPEPPFLPSIYPVPVSNQPDSPLIPIQNNQVTFPLNEIQSNPFYQNVVDVFEVVSHSHVFNPFLDTNIQPPLIYEIYSNVGESGENIRPFSSFIFSSSLDPQLQALENFFFSDLPERPC